MRATLQLPNSIVLIEAALTGLVEANRVLIRAGVVPLSPVDAGIKYKREDSGLEEWDVASTLAKRGWGDCEDINGWECAGIIEEGIDPDARLILIRTGRKTLHCVVQLSSGEIVDACPECGMRSRGDVAVRGLPWLEVVAGEDEQWIGRKYIKSNVKRGPSSGPRRSTKTPKKGRPNPRPLGPGRDRRPSSSYQAAKQETSDSTPTDTTKPETPTSLPPSMMPASASYPTDPTDMPMPMEDDEPDEEMEDGTPDDEEGEALPS
jgi:hypothetical protein